MDVFKNLIQPRAKMILQDGVQKIATYCKRTHRWQNRTGALEESINWTPPELKRGRLIATVFAGGWAKAKYALNYGSRKGGGHRRPNIRYQRGQRFKVKRGMGIFVNYARYVEKKGFPVLIHGVEKYRPLIARLFKMKMKVRLT